MGSAMNIETFGYRSDYAVEVLTVAPEHVRLVRFQRKRVAPSGGLNWQTQPSGSERLVKVSPTEGESWAGLFEPGVGRVTMVFATPSPSVVCVVVAGQAYWVPVLAPEEFEEIPINPVELVRPVPGGQVMVFMDFTRLAAYGPQGRRWLTEDLSWDGLEITEVTTNCIRGLAWDSPANRKVEFCVDVMTGASTGGSSPKTYGLS